MQSALGLVTLCALAWMLSEHRQAASLKVAIVGSVLQLVLAGVLLKVPGARVVFVLANEAFALLGAATAAGTSFVFGYLGGGPLPFDENAPGAGFILAFQALPLILVVSALTALLTYWRVLPALVRAFSMLLERTLGVGGAVGLATAANVFVGMVEAPLFIRPYLAKLSRSELFVMMTVGMATIAGTVLAVYGIVLSGVIANAPGHLLMASVISAPAAVTMALLMVPETGDRTDGEFAVDSRVRGSMDAITVGTTQGLVLVMNVAAMLIVLLAIVHIANALLGLAPEVAGEPLTWQRLLGWLMAPLCWLMGVPWNEAGIAGSLMGTKIVLNEFLAYVALAELPPDALGERSVLIMTYALCGFANFGSLGILIGGLTTMVPERRAEIVGLGVKSLIAGTLATCMTGAVIGILT